MNTTSTPTASTPCPPTGPTHPTSTITWLLHHAKPLRTSLVLSLCFRILGTAAWAIMLGAAMLALIQQSLPLLGVSIAAGLGKALFRYAEQYFGHWVAFTTLEHLRSETFAALHPQVPLNTTTNTHNSGTLLKNLTKDIDRLEVFYAHTIVPFASALIVSVCTLLATTWIDRSAAAVLLLGTLAHIALLWLSARATQQAAARPGGQLSQLITDALYGHSEIRGYHMERAKLHAIHQMEAASLQQTRNTARAQLLRTGLAASCHLLTLTGVAWASPSLPAAAVILAGAIAMLQQLQALDTLVPTLQSALTAGADLRDLQQRTPTVASPADPLPFPTTPTLTVVHPLLPAGRITLTPGTDATLTGPSGIGKTTLLRAIVRIHHDAQTQVLINDEPVERYDIATLRRAIAFVPHRVAPIRGSIRDNLCLAAPTTPDETIEAICQALGLTPTIQAAGGLDAPMGTWSGGQLARLGIARALLAQPTVLLLDEPYASLDAVTATRVQAAIRHFAPGATILTVSHNSSVVTQQTPGIGVTINSL